MNPLYPQKNAHDIRRCITAHEFVTTAKRYLQEPPWNHDNRPYYSVSVHGMIFPVPHPVALPLLDITITSQCFIHIRCRVYTGDQEEIACIMADIRHCTFTHSIGKDKITVFHDGEAHTITARYHEAIPYSGRFGEEPFRTTASSKL